MHRTLQKSEIGGNIELTDRDKLWIRAVHRFRFITTDQAELLSGSASRDKMNKRLKQLYDHDYLDRPKVQRDFSYEDKRHTVHALGPKGAKWLVENDGVRFPKGKGWRTANKLKSSERIGHQIGVVDTVIHFDRAVTAADGLFMSHQDELLATLDWPSGLKHYRLPTQEWQNGSLVPRGTDPDYTLSISRTVNGNVQNSLCFLEWDNSTEDFIKANRLASSIAQKHRCYADAYRRKLHQELYDFNNFRVLFVVKGTPERIAKMQQVCDRVVEDAPKGIFWYTTAAELEARGPLTDIWRTGEGKQLPLV
ncbi:hypothetical protein A8B75_10900 [Sphingomonadales bacterium EhC05]|nr:hypothetical protein A8B75_10900 [Sphingomonadales bacterium EhC05]